MRKRTANFLGKTSGTRFGKLLRNRFFTIKANLKMLPATKVCRNVWIRSTRNAGRAVIAFVTSPVGSAVLQTTLLPVDRRYAHARQAFWSARRDAVRPVIQRGIDRGELRPDTDAKVLLETLVAPIYARLIITGEPIDDEMPERIVDLVLDGAAAGRQN